MENKTTQTTETPMADDRVLCPVLLFRFFFRKNVPDTEATNEELDEINVEFSKYLRNKCNETQLANFMPKNEMEVFLNQEHPLKTNGFDPAFVLHFIQFVEIEAKKQQDALS